MNKDLVREEIAKYMAHRRSEPAKYAEEIAHREAHAEQVRRWTKEQVVQLDAEGLYRFISPLWAMLIWGNKQYVVDKLLSENGLGNIRTELSELMWGDNPVEERWDRFRSRIKGMGPAMMSEILCHVHPKTCPIWNRRARAGLAKLGVDDLPKYDYQVTGQRYVDLAKEMQFIARELREQGLNDADLLSVDYFVWDQLQPDTPLTQTGGGSKGGDQRLDPEQDGETSQFIHNEVRDKLADIGEWLGFSTSVETKVADGSKVDTIWQATIGNMGRVIYVFEVQTRGSIDSLILNLLKSLNNPAVQGVVAVSDAVQLEKSRSMRRALAALAASFVVGTTWRY